MWDPACGEGHNIDACRKFGVINAGGADMYAPFETMGKTDFLAHGVHTEATLTIVNHPFSQMKQFLIKMLEVKTKSAILMSSSAIFTQYFKEFIAVRKDICLLHVCEKYNFINEEGAAVDIVHVVLIIVGYGFPKLSANIVHIINTKPPS